MRALGTKVVIDPIKENRLLILKESGVMKAKVVSSNDDFLPPGSEVFYTGDFTEIDNLRIIESSNILGKRNR